jgi:prephenate dehydratase
MPSVDYRLPHKPRYVAMQGEIGSNSHVAIKGLFNGTSAVACDTISDAIAHVKAEIADLAVIPVLNTIADRVPYAMSLLRANGMKIVGETVNDIHHCVLGKKGATLSKAYAIYSHPHALGQCRKWLDLHPRIRPFDYKDTAGAARDLVAHGDDPGILAIAPRLAADAYKLDVLADSIQDDDDNKTHFYVVARELHLYPMDSRLFLTSMLLEMKNNSRKKAYMAEREFVGLFNGVGHPVVNKGDFTSKHFSLPTFFVEVEGHENSKFLQRALQQLKADKLVSDYSVMGCYPRHPNRRL